MIKKFNETTKNIIKEARSLVLSAGVRSYVGVLFGTITITLAAISIALAVIFSVYWCIWMLWLAVIPELFPSAYVAIKNPSFFSFVGFIFLFKILKNVLFKRATQCN